LSYRDKLALQLLSLHTIHPAKTPGETDPTRGLFVFILTSPSWLNKFATLTERSQGLSQA